AQLALEVLAHQARHWIGSYYLQLNGADALVFTAGIGENRDVLRQAICANLDQLGMLLDPEKNSSTRAQEAVISAASSRVKVMVIPTNEELVVAREVKRFLERTESVPPHPSPLPLRRGEGESSSRVTHQAARNAQSAHATL